jgi:hypothetical protein
MLRATARAVHTYKKTATLARLPDKGALPC